MAIQALNTIKKWFQTGLKPSQNQFWDTWDSFRHKLEKVPLEDVEELESILNAKAEKSELDEHKNDNTAHSELFAAKEDKSQKGIALGYAPLDEFSKIAYQYLEIVDNLTSGGTTSMLSAEQGVILQNQIDSIRTLLSSDNPKLDTFQKIADTIKHIQMSLDTILVNDLTTGGATKALTAEMGKQLDASKEDKSQKGVADGYVPLNDLAKIASQYLTIINDLTTGGSESLLSAEQGIVLQNQIDSINTLIASDNIDLDTIQEIVDAIEQVQMSLDTILVNDLTTGGFTKALTAEMGKQLNEIKLTATIATDAETQITTTTTEDNKVVSRSKLFNWWSWIISQTQTINAIWNFTKGIKADATYGTNNWIAQLTPSLFSIQCKDPSGYTNRVQFDTWFTRWTRGDYMVSLEPCETVPLTQNNTIKFQNKSGLVAFKDDYLRTPAGTSTMPPLIIPKGQLMSGSMDGAIERDDIGNLYETHGGVRSRIMTTSDSLIFLAYKAPAVIQCLNNSSVTYSTQVASTPTIVGKIGNSSVQRLNSVTNINVTADNMNKVLPNSVKTEVYIKINNGLFSTDTFGYNSVNQIKVMEYSGLNNNGNKNYQNLLIFYCNNTDPLKASISSVSFPLQIIKDGVITYTDQLYYLRDASNSRLFGAGEASFSFVFVNIIDFEDSTNSLGLNSKIYTLTNNNALFAETIR